MKTPQQLQIEQLELVQKQQRFAIKQAEEQANQSARVAAANERNLDLQAELIREQIATQTANRRIAEIKLAKLETETRESVDAMGASEAKLTQLAGPKKEEA